MRQHRRQRYPPSASYTPLPGKNILTNSHNHKEPRQEPSQIENPIAASIIDKVLGTAAPRTDCVWERRKTVRCHDEERVVVSEERRGQDHKEEADREDLVGGLVFALAGREGGGYE